ncbi:PRTRC system protein E [Flavobacterium sp.]|uniref:PRTRC system protein E n=1 Tax=Flavobacterium sp. TaxID=239 RepID=UPI003A95B190
MTTNFFNQIAQLDITGDIYLRVSKGVENNLIVSVMVQNEGCGDQAKHLIPPLTLRGTAAELDEGFFGQVSTPLQSVSGLMVNMEVYMKQLETAKAQSAMEKQKADKVKKEKEAKEKKYSEAMAKADELEQEGKYREAWIKVPNPSDYPEKTEAIRKRKSELSAKFAPDLFGEDTQKVAPKQEATDPEGLYPDYQTKEVEHEMDFRDEDKD